MVAAYGSNATVAKTEEELADRDAALYGDYGSADDIKINMPGHAQSNGETEMQSGAGNRSSIGSTDGHADGHHKRQSLDSLDEAEAGHMSRQLSMQREQSTALTGTPPHANCCQSQCWQCCNFCCVVISDVKCCC